MGANTVTADSVRISEIFYSLQGESRTVGLPTVFVRLTGCPLRCHYCDTEYAFHGGEMMSQKSVLGEVAKYGARYITVTGGEPLAQASCISLLKSLCDEGYEVSLETSGALAVEEVDERVSKVMDLKTPASGESAKNHWENLSHLTSNDQLKFVICDRDDYEWMKDIADAHDLYNVCEVLVSPSFGEINATDLADWLLEDQLPVRFQLQLHKILWNDEPGR